MSRPISIVWFERCYLGALVIGLINTALSWNTAMAMASANPAVGQLGPSFVPTMLIGGALIGIVIKLILWYFAARKGAVVAKWIIVVFFVLGLLGVIVSFSGGHFPPGLMGVLSIVDLVLGALSVWFLFQPDTKPWFGETRAV